MSHPHEPATAPTPSAQDTVPPQPQAPITDHIPPPQPVQGRRPATPFPAYPTPAVSSDLKGPGKPGARTARVVRLAILVIVLAAPVIGLLTWHPAQRNGNGQISHAGPITPDDLKVGDCFNAPDATSGISSVQAIPCTKPHDSQVFAKPAITESTYPGQTVLQSEADADCGDANRQSVISKSRPTGMSLINLFPQDDATLADQDYIICAIKSSTGTLTQSYVDASGVRS